MTEGESRRRAMYALRKSLRKMEVEDREREKILGTVRAQRNNDFLQSCGISPVTFDSEGQIVLWKGLICQKI